MYVKRKEPKRSPGMALNDCRNTGPKGRRVKGSGDGGGRGTGMREREREKERKEGRGKFSNTFICLHIPLYTFIYFYIPSYIPIYIKIPNYWENENQNQTQKLS